MRAQSFVRPLIGPLSTVAAGIVFLLAGRDIVPMPLPGAVGIALVLLATYVGGLASGLITAGFAIGVFAIALSSPAGFLTFDPEAAFRLAMFVVIAPVVAVVVALLQARVNASLAAERAHRERLEADNCELETLRAAIDQIDLGVILLDRDMRARFISRAVLRATGLPESMADSAPTLRELLKAGCETGVFAVPKGKRDAYIAARLAEVQAGDPTPRELRLGSGEITRMQCAVLPDGGRLLTYTLVTDLIRQAEELRTVRDALDQIDYGIVLLDRRMRAEFINRAVCELGNLRQPLPGEKPSFEALIRQVADNGTYAVPPEELDAYVTGRVEWAGGRNPSPYEIHRADGRITRVKCIVLRDGARMLTYTDETEALRQVDRLEELASVDPLTGLHNRRYFEQAAEQEWVRFLRYRRPLSLLLIDIDRFKSINDRFGHDAGDTVLREVAAACRSGKRESDIVARIGGEEFAVLLPETALDMAVSAGERIRQTVAAQTLPLGEGGLSITLSIGVATANPGMTGIDSLTKQADVALYAAKGAGRNRVMSFPDKRRVRSTAA